MTIRILLTGSSGFIGSAFLAYASSRDWTLRILTRRVHSHHAHIPNLELIEGDLAYTTDWSAAVKGVDIIVNLAADIRNHSTIYRVNHSGPLLLLRAAQEAGVKRWIQLSSVGAYGPLQTCCIDEQWPDSPSNDYELSKAKFDKNLISTSSNSKLDYCILRPSIVYGQQMRNQSLSNLIQSIKNRTFFYIGPPESSANYVHVSDVVQALALCVDYLPAINKTYIVSNWAPFEHLVAGLAEGYGLDTPKLRISTQLAKLLALPSYLSSSWPLTLNRVKAMSTSTRYITTAIENDLGWSPSVTVLDGMRQYAAGLKP
jgi:nucleoside-diphosphate-sugar epimerase